jgi:hypothetical protein
MTLANNIFIWDEFKSMWSRYSLIVQYYFIGMVLHSLTVLILFAWAVK